MLKERGLPSEGSLVFEYPASQNRPGCNSEGNRRPHRVLGVGGRKGHLKEEISSVRFLGHDMLCL